tara:strand:- start:474 stop:2645 length:2172 start_codon:yes stop_codon:yes gene_type:complete
MPRLPDPSNIRRSTARASRQVVQAPVNNAGRGLQELGRAVGDTANYLEQKIEQKNKSKGRLELSKANAEWTKLRASQNNAYNQDDDFDTIEERYRGELGTKSSEISAAISDPETREIFQNKIGSDIEVGSQSIKNLAFRKETDFETARLTEDIASLRDIALEGDTEEAIGMANERINATLESGFISENQAVSIRQQSASDYAIARIKIASPDEKVALLKGGLGKFIDKDIQKQLLKGAAGEYTRNLDDYVAYLSAGNQPTEEMEGKFSSEKINAITGDNAKNINEAVSDAKEFGAAVNQVKTATPEETRQLLAKSKPTDSTKFRRESKQQQALSSAINKRNKAISNDPAQYVNHAYEDVGRTYEAFTAALDGNDSEALQKVSLEYADAQRDAQEELGLPAASVQLLPQVLEDKIASQLNNFTEGGENPALFLDTLKTSFREEWDTVQRQLQSSKKIGSTIRVMAGMDFGPEVIALGEANSIGQKAYKDVIGNDLHKAITDDSMEILEEFQDTVRDQPGGEGAYIQHKTAIETLAMKYVADGMFDDSSEALEKAYDDVIGSRFEFIGSYRVPTKYSPNNVELGVDNTLEQIKEGKFNLFIPQSNTVLNDEDRKNVYYTKLAPEAITSPDGDGILFIDQSGNALLSPEGDPLIVPFEELEKTRDEGYFGFFGDEEVQPEPVIEPSTTGIDDTILDKPIDQLTQEDLDSMTGSQRTAVLKKAGFNV